ncbi:MAG: adenylate kinase [Spirochaetales bacterium]
MQFVFLGPPGAGKGTLAKQAAETLNIPHISTGDLFREAIKQNTALGQKVKEILARGDLVPDAVTIQLVKDRLSGKDGHKGYILDGFPRTIIQAEALQTFAPPELVINFQLSEEEIIKRLSGRRSCPSCGAIFHVVFNPPRENEFCDICGKELIIRKDDTIEAIKNRLTVYSSQTVPLIDFYFKRGILRTIDASPSPQEVLKSFLLLIQAS